MKRLIALTQTLTLAVTGLMTPLLASAHDYSRESVRVDHPWSRPTPPGVTVGVGYMSISNNGDTDVTLIAAESANAGQVSIHQSTMVGGVMRMEPLPQGLVIPAGTTVDLKPHSYHLMLEQLSGQLMEGERVPLTLEFDNAPSMNVELAVEPLDGGDMPMGQRQMDHGAMDHSGMDMEPMPQNQ